jgi:tyrosyl-tRNA synthetase
MAAKKRLARTIVADFHGEEAASAASENWARMFQQKEAAEDLEEVAIAYADVANVAGSASSATNSAGDWEVRLPKLLVKIGLAASGSEANRKIVEGAVKVEGKVCGPVFGGTQPLPARLVVRLGKRAKIALIS